KKQIFEKKKSSAINHRVLLDVTCIDCGKGGHYTKQYFKCESYEPETADQVGSKDTKRKQNFEIKKEKKKARKENNEEPDKDNACCTKCKQPGHKSMRSEVEG
ncbi:hypothetical protein BDF20DRAFT_886732, partial [Mycotypha africana]|uniref:uncharacterized protein n=1 Tax=Mycotypha africana TaxID=64632 RepID=UPI00230005FC